MKEKRLSKYKTKQKLKTMLNRIQVACKEDNIQKFEYAIVNVLHIGLGVSINLNKGLDIDQPSYKKIVQFVYQTLKNYNPKQISEVYFKEFEEAFKLYEKPEIETETKND